MAEARLPILCFAIVMLATANARADGPLGPQGSTIATSDYKLDLFTGPVLASSRTTGLAGASAAIAEGVDGYSTNAAAPAVRLPWSVNYIDYDLSIGVTVPGTFAGMDFDNNGGIGIAYRKLSFFNFGANVQIGTWAFGFTTDVRSFSLSEVSPAAASLGDVRVSIWRFTPLLAKSLFGGQIVIGLGLRSARLGLEKTDNTVLFSTTSIGTQLGVVYAPILLPLRLGATVRSQMKPDTQTDSEAIKRDPVTQDVKLGEYFIPNTVEIPWELEMGAAFQIGPRPLNVRWRNPHDRAEYEIPQPGGAPRLSNEQLHKKLLAEARALPREKLLILASVLVSGPVDKAVGFESFMLRKVERSGMKTSVTPRIGLEGEVIPGWLQLRGGSYLEPSRYEGGRPRLHGTFGLDVRLFEWDAFGLVEEGTSFRFGGFVDGAYHYVSWGITAGVWH